ncbi:hypothetical protein TAMA11512_21930 [Selenomonas sp. TAMA-11512]|uniref:glycosyltransferase family 2 protein n=1 Tax=Selenomonas sp. TAMA-11512 TaxID=3095337 RepID=UPI003088F3FF|nr:hypothetical protein TAMA11512_21930 [Selenomonas sp. TAMA-11512]
MLVSIIIPVYNVEQYIEKCLDSVLGQTYQKLDVICINDGSTDDSLAVLRRYEAQDSRVRIIDKGNGGVVSAREAGLRIANGEYTTFVDPDDWVESNAVMEMVTANQVYQADMVACGFWKEQGDASSAIFNGLEAGYYSPGYLKDHPEDWFFSYTTFREPVIGSLCTKLIRTKLIQEVHRKLPFSMVYGEDVVAVLLACASCNGLLSLSGAWYHYIHRDGSAATQQRGFPKGMYHSIYQLLETVTDGAVERKKCLDAYMKMLLLEQEYETFSSYGTLFPFSKVSKGSRIFLYGAGLFGRMVHRAIMEHADLSLAGWTDRAWQSEALQQFALNPLSDIYKAEFDVLVLALLNESLCREIAFDMIQKGLSEEKICFVENKIMQEATLPAWVTSI